MPFIEWNQNISVEITSIDNQHKELISLLNNLYDAVQSNDSDDIMREVFSDLLQYTANHFAAEEKMMRVHNYPMMIEHKFEHDELTRQSMDLYDKYRIGKVTMTIDVLNFLKTWLSNHILSTDVKLGQFLKSKGIR